ncbi:MAG: hypothetical protein ACRDWT_13185 [Jatrophihabitantaceae bacterium]
MTAAPAVGPPAPRLAGSVDDHRGSPIPTGAMIATRFMELRKRRGLLAALSLVTVGIPTVFLLVRLLLHAIAPKTYGPAGGYSIYTGLSAGVLYVFGFIVAAALGCTAGSVDLTDGMFRHLVVTGRSRLALYLARIPAGLAIIVPLVAIGFSVVCAVCVFAAPRTADYDGLSVPAGMSQPRLEAWAADNATKVICDLPYTGNVAIPAPCGNGPGGPGPVTQGQPGNPVPATAAELRAAAIRIADLNYADYRTHFAAPSNSLMIKTGLWIELEAVIGFVVGLGLGSLLGQRTVGVILMIVLEVVLTPIFIRTRIPHLENLQRAVVGIATAHLEPGQLPLAFGGGGHDYRLTESSTTAVLVILAWLIGWTVLGAWRMMTRDA